MNALRDFIRYILSISLNTLGSTRQVLESDTFRGQQVRKFQMWLSGLNLPSFISTLVRFLAIFIETNIYISPDFPKMSVCNFIIIRGSYKSSNCDCLLVAASRTSHDVIEQLRSSPRFRELTKYTIGKAVSFMSTSEVDALTWSEAVWNDERNDDQVSPDVTAAAVHGRVGAKVWR